MAGELILVVDDEANIVELARLYLERENFRVEEASSGEEALSRFEELNPALIILDIMIPAPDGWEVCRRVRSRSQVPIIMLTAREDEVDKVVGLELGADDYLTKPFSPRELVARVRSGTVKEVVIATSSTVPGEATASFLVDTLLKHPVSVTRLACGIPMGMDIKYADKYTLARAIEARSPAR